MTRWIAVLLALLGGFCSPLYGQQASEGFVGSEMENYLRTLQIAEPRAVYPWSIRAFSPREVKRLLLTDSAHPWKEHYSPRPDTSAALDLELLRPSLRTTYNSAFAYGVEDGPVWSGRGITTALQAGFTARAGRLSLTVAPVVFWAENRDFPLQANGREGQLSFGDGLADVPQRFGDAPYARIDPGQTTLRADVAGLALGASTANQQWGPAQYHPILLGNNGPGFPHLFVGTSRPVDIGIGKAHARLLWGSLAQSAYSPVPADSAGRLFTGIVGVFTPSLFPGLELGFARVFHSAWAGEGIPPRQLFLAFETFWKKNTNDPFDKLPGDDNQLAAAFFRVALPRSGAEFYGEYGREDHSIDIRDFIVEPDHTGVYVLGLRKLLRSSPGEFLVMSGEVANAQASHLIRVRWQGGPFYTHAHVRQGHTNRGQLLGSPAIYGGGGSVLALDRYSPGGRWSVRWRRAHRQDLTRTLEPDPSMKTGDLYYSLQGEALRIRGRWEITAGLAGVYNQHRYRESDVFNLNATLGVSRAW